ncbi:hypothetical protein ACFVS7_03720 [Streptomyces rubiginosohelvolus]|uniref:hypothetical protein n=1 Tax=Streptomyces rubiginosohelvolus TaxID=67362 RepID=UPI0036DBB32B
MIDRLSGSCTADLRRLERTRFWPEATEDAFWHWKALAHGPLRHLVDPMFGPDCGFPECGCHGAGFREHLETVLHLLPRKSARELRALVRAFLLPATGHLLGHLERRAVHDSGWGSPLSGG